MLQRPASEGIELTGHHEVILPLLYPAVAWARRSLEKDGRENARLEAAPFGRHARAEGGWRHMKQNSDCGAMGVSELAKVASGLGSPESLWSRPDCWTGMSGEMPRASARKPGDLLQADKREERLGGASSVSTLLAALGARVDLCGVTGADDQAPGCGRFWMDLAWDTSRLSPTQPAHHRQGTVHWPGPAPSSSADDPGRLRGKEPGQVGNRGEAA